ncbi:NAD-glutamate dehydrogenase domain-containing protein [Rhodococcus sp. NPDC059234]|uniref:NAD-glutamate dehydrogenase domain-containing protein n=1 Tax=Rhodococcus sp. NPDC059234 TaxID=3346781 RepID=UPI00366A5BB8
MSHTGVGPNTLDATIILEGRADRIQSGAEHPASLPRLDFLDAGAAQRHPAAIMVWPGGTPVLAEVVATLANLGLRVATHAELDPAGLDLPATVTAHRFDFCSPAFPWTERAARLVSEAFAAAATGDLEMDGFVQLVAAAELEWTDAVLIRAACRYLRQVGLELSTSTMLEILLEKREFVIEYCALFHARFRPDHAERQAATQSAEAAVRQCVEQTATLDEDRLLRGLWSFIGAILRTNWFQGNHARGTVVAPAAFKLDPTLLSLTVPVTPYREIFVHSPVVEGSHVRGGSISRGGLRWSDRRDDFRTEVLGLMKTQNVKNSLIVPMGAKGAFVVRGSADPTPDEVRSAYSAFIGGLLDVTDNILDGQVVHPADTVIYDEDDAYLVVAADKGTARFSDLANSIAIERGFWLGDAFASGGSAGYDHKAMAITARGGWRSVRRHFAELGLDVDTDLFTVVGIGDMSGDVFGNGMLLSRAIRLVGAFDHRHIFLDPDPDPESSFRERERLASLPRSSWADYERALISAGGGVWPRTAKSIPLAPEVRRRLGVSAAELPPHEVIRAILTAEVDLLWNGGVGTYVKASFEGHQDASDPANDLLRVDANSLRCRVIGEGGNLGLTQRARVEYALAGGKVNADFIDNAAGVATSDREVNLKIALDAAVTAGRIDTMERNALLAGAEKDVARSVLADADSQTLAISLAEAHAPFLLGRHERLIQNLERDAGISRVAEVLPSSKELEARQHAGRGLVRPEIAVLLAQSKNVVLSELLESDLIDGPVFADTLTEYFPAAVRNQIPEQVRNHRLAREIRAVLVANELIDRVGPGFIHRLEERFGVSTPVITTAYAVVSESFGIHRLWNEALTVPDATQSAKMRLLHGIQELIEQATSWVLRHRSAEFEPDAEIARLTPAVADLTAALPRLSGIAERDVSTLRTLAQALAFGESARELELPITLVADTYSELGSAIGLDWVAENFSTGAGHWNAMAAGVLTDGFQENWHRLVRAVLRGAPADTRAADAVQRWVTSNPTCVGRLTQMTGEFRRSGRIDNSRVCVVNSELDLAVAHA